MSIFGRRFVFLSLVLVSAGALLVLMAYALSKDGYAWPEFVLLLCFAVTLPWTVIGFWNAVTGLLLMRLTDDPAQHVFPALEQLDQQCPITSKTAVALCVRNEDVAMVRRNLETMIDGLVTAGEADRFHFFVLSDSFDPQTIREEEAAVHFLKTRWTGLADITYRRRDDNAGYKAGNIRDFCERWGHNYEFMLTLDADSVMSAQTILRMVQIMEQNERVGIVQSLVVGLPSVSPFTRVFQFGMRLGMRSYTLGSAWWQSDCGPYWGHNALLRMKPFVDHCHLPKLAGRGPLSGWILSHDQVEAVYMRRAGYECRVLAEECDSFEENPPHILEFIRRDLRWCHGNMQYFKLLSEPGLEFTSRIQLVLAILMFIGSPAWMLFVTIATASLAMPEYVPVSMHIEQAGFPLFVIVMTMVFAPKIASFADTILDRQLRNRFGGLAKTVLSSVTEFVFSMLLAPVVAIANTIFLFQLFVLKKPKSWAAQSRAAGSLPLGLVTWHLWPQTLFGGIGLAAVMASEYSGLFVYLFSLPVFLGPLISIGLGRLTSSKSLGLLLAKWGVWQIPEEFRTPEVVSKLTLPAVLPDVGQQSMFAEGMVHPAGHKPTNAQIDPAE